MKSIYVVKGNYRNDLLVAVSTKEAAMAIEEALYGTADEDMILGYTTEVPFIEIENTDAVVITKSKIFEVKND